MSRPIPAGNRRPVSCLPARHAAAAALAAAIPAHAFVAILSQDKEFPHWDLVTFNEFVHPDVVNRDTASVRFYLGEDAWSAGNTTAELNAVRAAFDQWQSVPGSHLRFEEAGLLPPPLDVNTSDNRNIVYWEKESTRVNGGRDSIAGTLAVTFIATLVFPTTPEIILLAEADIVFNGFQEWSTAYDPPDPDRQFIEAVALHEIGHFIGIEHTPLGGATMMFRNAPGLTTSIGLSPDEVAAARTLYPAPDAPPLGEIAGIVTRDGSPLYGAMVLAEDADGNVAGATLTFTDGSYRLPRLPPGTYGVRAAPLDPNNLFTALIRGRDIAPEFADIFGDLPRVASDFRPTPATNTAVTAGNPTTVNVAVTAGNPAFRLSHVRPPEPSATSYTRTGTGIAVDPGAQGVWIGVFGQGLPTAGTTLTVSGTGITPGEQRTLAPVFGNSVLVTRRIDVAADAAPGLRTLTLQHATGVAHANGFLEVRATVPDVNFDGLDDRFQRTHFDPFTGIPAAPGSDPDGDGFNNSREAAMGTDPNDPFSRFRVESVHITAEGARVVWHSNPGRSYQVHFREDVDGASWTPLGSPVVASQELSETLDPAAGDDARFYWIEELP